MDGAINLDPTPDTEPITKTADGVTLKINQIQVGEIKIIRHNRMMDGGNKITDGEKRTMDGAHKIMVGVHRIMDGVAIKEIKGIRIADGEIRATKTTAGAIIKETRIMDGEISRISHLKRVSRP